ncbi:ComEA family DNA-binding protein [Vibrio agarivorans]|uniref:ComEA family DNA-binding protein n=1 Tax=Vibrio agarivorans TaxID=153622 RepID=UPI0025B38063|nr:helix-hairpin-helix domain-containing protein [Vibrio agarivorans]MDN3661028.1 helix-hairpin-helix domain-containing protein [Vibrio agarivorans]
MKHHLSSILFAVLLAVSFPYVATANEKPDKYEGIEITVNINTATADELATLLVGVGTKKAQAIVDYRSANGEFKTPDDLTNVKGIGSSLLEKNQQRIKL